MATLYIAEFEEMPHTSGSKIPVALQPPLAEQTVAIGGASVASAAFNARTRFVRLHNDVICSVRFDLAPTASATTARMAAGATEYHGVQKGVGMKVAVITNT